MKLERFCLSCGKSFECNGNCHEKANKRERHNNKNFCSCHDCYLKKWGEPEKELFNEDYCLSRFGDAKVVFT